MSDIGVGFEGKAAAVGEGVEVKVAVTFSSFVGLLGDAEREVATTALQQTLSGGGAFVIRT